MLVNSNELFNAALKEGYAIPAYNVNNLEWIKFVLEACQEDNSPVILAVTPKSIQYFGGYKVVYNVVNSLISELNINIPVVLHLDHAKDFDSCKKAIDAGFTSVMIDASLKTFEQNVDITNKVIDYAKKRGVNVEAELGVIKTDGYGINDRAYYSDLEDSKNFVIQTGIDSFAPSIGNVHGFYKENDNLDFDLLGAICKEVKIPLVLHGGSNLDENKLKAAIFCGVVKVNFNTDLMHAWSLAVREYLKKNVDVYDPRKIILSGEDALKEVVHKKNCMIGSKNRK